MKTPDVKLEKTLSDDLKSWRAERPDEWTMDRFISGAVHLEGIIGAQRKALFTSAQKHSEILSNYMHLEEENRKLKEVPSMDDFEAFSREYNLYYDLTRLGDSYANRETHKAFIVFKHRRS